MSNLRPGTAAVFLLLLALALSPVACGGGKPGGDDGSGRDFEVREAVTGALENDRAIDENAAGAIQGAKAGTEPLEATLDQFVDQTKSLLSVIASVIAPAKPPDARLAKARDLTAEYLRNRVHQVELALSAKSPGELESLYAQGKAELDPARAEIVRLLLSYDPQLEQFLR